MTAFTGRFTIPGQVTLDANGNGVVELDPPPQGWEAWEVTHVGVRTSQAAGSTPIPTADVYKNDETVPANWHGGTRDGDHDTARGTVWLQGSDVLRVVFTGGPAGVTAYATATGTYTATRAFPG